MSVTASTEGRAVSTTRTMSPIARAFASPKINGILFTLPAIILVLLVIVLPLLQSFYFSFTNWKGARADWIGLGNYTQIFADPELRKSLINSMLIFISIPFGMIGPFVTAYLLYNGMPGRALHAQRDLCADGAVVDRDRHGGARVLCEPRAAQRDAGLRRAPGGEPQLARGLQLGIACRDHRLQRRDVGRQHHHLPDRPCDHRQIDDRSGAARRGQRAAGADLHHPSLDAAVRRVRLHHHRRDLVHRALRAHLRDDRRRAGVGDDDARLRGVAAGLLDRARSAPARPSASR